MPVLRVLFLVQARRERIVLPVWILGIVLLGFAVSCAVATEFGDEADRAAIVIVAAVSPAFLFLCGLPAGTGIGFVGTKLSPQPRRSGTVQLEWCGGQ